MYNEGVLTFQAGEDLAAHRRVKIEGGTTTVPPEVVYADAGEQAIGVTERACDDGDAVAVKVNTFPGSIECEAADTFSTAATLYAAADGKVSDSSNGTAIGIAKEACTAAGDIVEVLPFVVASTTAGTVSVADTGAFTSTATVEAALAEIYQHIQSAQNFIPIPIAAMMIGDASNTVSFGGPATDPVLDMTNGDTDSALRWSWVATSVEELVFQVPLPPNLDTSADIVLHLRTSKGTDSDTVTIASDAYFNEGDTKVEDVSGTVAAAAGETTITIAAADIPAGAQTLTVELTPSAHANDALYLYAAWLEYTGTTLAS